MPSSSSEYTTAPSSPIKRKRGRPPLSAKRKRIPPGTAAEESLTKLSSEDEALKNNAPIVTKELKIVLTRCDAYLNQRQQDESSRPSSSLTIEPPHLEVNNAQLALISPGSSVASGPPVLVKEVNYSHTVPHSVALSSSQTVAQSTSTNLNREHAEEIHFQKPVSPSRLSPCVQTDNQCSPARDTTNDEVIYQNGVVDMDEIAELHNNVIINSDPSDTRRPSPPILTAELPIVFEDGIEEISSIALPEPKPVRNVAAVLPRARKVCSQSEVGNKNKKLNQDKPFRFLSQSKLLNGNVITAASVDEQSSEAHVIVNQAFSSSALHCPPLSDMSHCNGVVESNNCGAVDGSNCLRTETEPPPPLPEPICFSQSSSLEPPPLVSNTAVALSNHVLSQSSSLEPPPFVSNTAVALSNHVLPPQSVYQCDSNSDIAILSGLPIQNGVVSQFDDPTTDEEDDGGVVILENPLEDFCDFKALATSAETLFNKPPFIQPKIMWFSCVLFATKVLHELTSHEQMCCQLFTTTNIGRLLADSVHNEGHSWPGVAQMDWRKPFIALDIITSNYRTCGPPGCRPCLRVQEKSAADTVSGDKSPRLWDLVIDKECENLVEEMIRLFRVDVKTTVIIWGARKQYYPVSWKEDVVGELLLMPTNKEENVLSVLIFHHEDLSLERGRLIHGPFPDSELWHLQDPDLGYRNFVQVEIRGEPSKPTHLTLHTLKPYIPPEGLPPKPPPCPLVLFPEDGEPISDTEEQQLIESFSRGEDECDDDQKSEKSEPWDDFVSISRAASRAGSRSPVAKTAHDDLIECAERLFQKPKDFTSPPKVGQNPVQGVGANHLATGVGAAISPRNGDGNVVIIEDRNQNHHNGNAALYDIAEEEIHQVNYHNEENGLREPVISESQKEMFMTQELIIISDGESEEDQQQQENRDNLGKAVLTRGNQVANTLPSQSISGNNSSKPSKVVPSRSKCNGGKDNKLCNGGNSRSGIRVNAENISKRNGNVVGSAPASQQQDCISFSESSANYNFSAAINEL